VIRANGTQTDSDMIETVNAWLIPKNAKVRSFYDLCIYNVQFLLGLPSHFITSREGKKLPLERRVLQSFKMF